MTPENRSRRHGERHLAGRAGWLRAAVLGADDGIVSTASLVLGVAASSASRSAILTAGLAGLVAGAMSMAAGEYVSVSSQRDAERADLGRERLELATDAGAELSELASIYEQRGLRAELALEVAEELSKGDRLAAHMRDELGLSADLLARPVQAAVTSAGSFALGALVPIVMLVLAPTALRAALVAAVSLAALALLGAASAAVGGAPRTRAASRVLIGGAAAMGATAVIGGLVGAVGV